MTKRIEQYAAAVFTILFVVACRKPYNFPGVMNNLNYLVVEGVINSGTDSTNIKLSRTTTLGDTSNFVPENNATVTVESDAGDVYLLTQNSAGNYGCNGLALSLTKNYRLHIVTSNGVTYQSDFMQNEQTPPIDSVGYLLKPTGVQFYVNTHDPTNNTHYYRWDYSETWTYFSAIGSAIYYQNGKIVPRPNDSLINMCYRFAQPSNSIFVSTSAHLSHDVIYQYPLGYADLTSDKLTHEYSLLVKQYAISADAYTYWTILKKNTEQLGSIFDPQPTSLTGNIHCVTDPAEPVIGYISVSTIATKRIFLQGSDLPFHFPPDQTTCSQNALYIAPSFTFKVRLDETLANGDSLLTYYIADPATNQVTGYQYSSKECVDCRLAGGTTVKPAYWIY